MSPHSIVPIEPRPARHVDARGCAVSGATPAGLLAYERALAALLAWRPGAEEAVEQALQAAPRFVMAHVLRGYLLVCSRDPRQYARARDALAATADLDADARERLHLSALAAVIADDHRQARSRLDACLELAPLDLLALHAAQSFDHLLGDAAGMLRRAQRVLAAWPAGLDGRAAVASMHAFALVEAGESQRAEEVAQAVLAREPLDVRTHHVMAHVFEMSDRPVEGRDWFRQRIERLGIDRALTAHCWWHLALFELAAGDAPAALRLYDRRFRGRAASQVADLIDATALLWRIALSGGSTHGRWNELAVAWRSRIDDRFCSFNDVHAMLAFVGAGDREAAERLERTLVRAQSLTTRYAATTREIGLPACRALIALGRGDDARAVALLSGLPGSAWRLGGSHAQRDVLYLTLLRAVERLRRPTRRLALGRRAGATEVLAA